MELDVSTAPLESLHESKGDHRISDQPLKSPCTVSAAIIDYEVIRTPRMTIPQQVTPRYPKCFMRFHEPPVKTCLPNVDKRLK